MDPNGESLGPNHWATWWFTAGSPGHPWSLAETLAHLARAHCEGRWTQSAGGAKCGLHQYALR